MALAVDAASSSSDDGTPSSLTWSHTCTGSDRGLVVGVTWVAASVTISSVTYNGVTMTSEGAVTSTLSSALHLEQFSLIAPDTGANNIVVTFSAAVAGVIGGGVSYTGANQTDLTGTQVSVNNGVSSPATVDVSSASDEIVQDVVLKNSTDTITVGASQTQRWNVNIGTNGLHNGGGSTETGASTTTMSWTFSGVVWIIAAIAVKPAAGGATTNVTLTAAVAVAATLATAIIRAVNLSAAVVVAATLARAMTFARTLSVGVIVTPTLARVGTFTRTLAAAVLVTPTLTLAVTYQRLLQSAATVAATLSVATTFARTLAAPIVVNATVTVLRVIVVALSAAVTVTATLTTLFIAGVTAAKNRLVGLIRGIGISGRP